MFGIWLLPTLAWVLWGPPPKCSSQTRLENLRIPLDVLGHIDTNIAKLGVWGGLVRGDNGSERGWRGKVWGARDSNGRLRNLQWTIEQFDREDNYIIKINSSRQLYVYIVTLPFQI